MPLHVILAIATYLLLPLIATSLILHVWHQGHNPLTRYRFLAALLLGGIVSFPITMVVWTLCCFIFGITWGIFSGDLSGSLQSAMKRVVPLASAPPTNSPENTGRHIIPWGLWHPIAAWVPVMTVTYVILRRRQNSENNQE